MGSLQCHGQEVNALTGQEREQNAEETATRVCPQPSVPNQGTETRSPGRLCWERALGRKWKSIGLPRGSPLGAPAHSRRRPGGDRTPALES